MRFRYLDEPATYFANSFGARVSRWINREGTKSMQSDMDSTDLNPFEPGALLAGYTLADMARAFHTLGVNTVTAGPQGGEVVVGDRQVLGMHDYVAACGGNGYKKIAVVSAGEFVDYVKVAIKKLQLVATPTDFVLLSAGFGMALSEVEGGYAAREAAELIDGHLSTIADRLHCSKLAAAHFVHALKSLDGLDRIRPIDWPYEIRRLAAQQRSLRE